jgi:hypothetical protein
MLKLLAVLLLAFSAVASPVITSVTPSLGPTSGGIIVVIRGSGFSNNCVICSPPFADPAVSFGGIEATSVTYVSPTELHAVTPPHIPGTVDVTVSQLDGSDPNFDVYENGFTYTGAIEEAYEPILFPVFLPPIQGRNGSEFRTEATLWNRSRNQPVTIFGYDRTCTLIDPPIGPETPFTIMPQDEFEVRLFPECSDSVGRLLYVPSGDKNISASLRVYETSRQGENHGVEIPVVRREDFSDDTVALLSVPNDPKFRITLRIYSLNTTATVAHVSFNNYGIEVPMQPSNNIFVPSYAEVSGIHQPEGFPALPDKVRVQVWVNDAPVWAFITVTNNETQHITTITPQQ